MTTDAPPIPETWTPPAIARSADHRYTYQGETYPGVTSILQVVDKSEPLKRWAAKQTAYAAIAHLAELPKMLETVGPEGVQKFLTARPNWTNQKAKDTGTDVHAMAELVVKGEPTPAMSETTRHRVLAYAEWWKASGWRLRLSEAMVVFPRHKYGGTFDLLAFDRDGKTVLCDIKTGNVYKEAALQLAAYGLAPIVSPTGSATAYPMPPIDRYVVIHVPAEGNVREVEINVGTAEHMAWMACIDLHAWTEGMKGKRF